jgi:bifunctional non-homologous end joining protein LigD
VLKRTAFVVPTAPVLKRPPPSGPQWIHEVKFDGWRGRLHKAGADVTIYSRNGKDLTHRFPTIRQSLQAFPARSAIVDSRARHV